MYIDVADYLKEILRRSDPSTVYFEVNLAPLSTPFIDGVCY
jgi:hypothetical protein